MQTRILGMILATFAMFFLGCGAEPTPHQGTVAQLETTVSTPANSIANEQTGIVEEGDAEQDGSATDPHGLLGKKCYADCSVVNTGAPSCPSRINGFGETTFLGGCAKACRKARGDAASKLPTGCSLGNCSTTGC
jgi:hypothetical protein